MQHTFFRASALLFGSLLIASGLGSIASAQSTLYWDGDSSGPVDGGTGTWNTTLGTWSTDATTSTVTVWDNTAPTDHAVFQNTAGTVIVNADVIARSLTFGTTGYAIYDYTSLFSGGSPSTLTLDGGSGSIDTGSGNQVIEVTLAGDDGLTKSGTGTLSLFGTNTYTGATVVKSGTLTLATGGSISTPASQAFIGNVSGDDGALQLSGGTLSNTDVKIGNAVGSEGAATVTSGTWTNSGTLWVGYSGTGSLLVNGGTVTSASAVLGFTGTTGNGSVTVSSGSWTNSGSLLVGRAGNGSLAVSGGLVTVEGVTTTGFFSGSTGAITLSGTSGNRGTLSTNQIVELVGGGAGTITFDGGILQSRADESDFISNYESGDVTIDSGGAFIDSNGFAIGISTVLGGTGGLTKQGAGTLTLNGVNTYTGGTTISAGTLSLGHATDTLADTGAVTISGGTLALGANSDTVGAVSLSSGNITGSGGALTGSSYAFTDTGSVSASLAGSGALTKTGAGTVTLSSAITSTGEAAINYGTYDIATLINAGTLALTSTGSITHSSTTLVVGNLNGDDGTLTIANGGSVSSSAGVLGDGTGSTGTADIAGTWTNQNGFVVGSSGSGSLTVQADGIVSNTYGLLGSSAGSSGSADIAGTWTNASTLIVGGGGTGSLTVQAGGLVSNTTGYLGYNSGSTGTGTVSGTWTNSDHLYVGRDSTGTLNIQDGGIVNAASGGTHYTTYLAANSGSIGTLNITGSTAAGILDAGYLTGGDGTATLNFNHTDPDYHFTRDGTASASDVTINGSTSVNHLGTGTTTLSVYDAYSGGNTYTGGTTVAAGTLIQGASAAFAANTAVTVNGGSLDLNNFDLTASSLSGAGGSVDLGTAKLTVAQSGDTTYAGVILGIGGSVTKQGAGTLTLTGANTFDGGTAVEAGTLTQGASAGFAAHTAYVVNGGSLDLNNFDLTASSLSGGGGSVDLGDLYPTTLTVAQSSTTTYAGTIIGAGGLTKQGTGTLSLSGTNTYTSGTTVNAGTLAVTGTGSLSHPSARIFVGKINGDDGTLEIANGGSVSSVFSYLGHDAGSTGTADISGTWTNQNQLYVGLNGTGSLTVPAGGSVSNTYGYLGVNSGSTGTAEISGTWTNTNNLSIGNQATGSLTVLDGGLVNVKSGIGTTSLASGADSAGTLNITGSTAAGILNTATVNGGAGTAILNFNHTDSDYHFSTDGAATGTGVAITGSTAVNHLGTGTTTLSGSSSYSGGTTVPTGTLLQGASSAFSSNSGYTINGGTLDLNGFAMTAAALSGTGGSVDLGTAKLTVNQAATTSYDGTILGTGGSLSKQGAGNLSLTGTHTYSGGTTISAGTLALGHATDTLADTGAVAISGGTLALGANSDTVGAVSLSSGSITGAGTLTSPSYAFTNSGNASAHLAGSGALTKTGFGTVTLTGTNTYSAGTTVTGGFINFSNGANLGTGGVTLNPHISQEEG